MIGKAALWKYDGELGIAYFCPDCKRFVCSDGKCDCGTEIDLSLPKTKYCGKVKWENYRLN
ncbi:MAG: hypothetical protein K0R92_539 [Lachnospiraceae bacterium]|jgi:hypothetical protein|nr:hypothetical protein [Lachnospiraceae bacterium]